MAESSVAAPQRDVLLATKLHMPGPRPGQVLRPRLTARLDEGLAGGLILASAPAGYGKTVLLADWARRGKHPVAWLSLDAGDNDPARFWRHVVVALDQGRPGIAARIGSLLGPPAPQIIVEVMLEVRPYSRGSECVLDDRQQIDFPIGRTTRRSRAFIEIQAKCEFVVR
jgi:LuxR family maltose regulon positive regulatory protein